MRMKQKKIFFWWKFKMADFSKWPFFKIANSQKNFVKISQIGPWVSRIDWCEGHWCSSNYMVVSLSDIRAKTGKKCIFCLFGLFLPLYQTASRLLCRRCINRSKKREKRCCSSRSEKIGTKCCGSWCKVAFITLQETFFKLKIRGLYQEQLQI